MQERRTLIYMDKDDIPSTALEVTSEALTGNILYVPARYTTAAQRHFVNVTNVKPLWLLSYDGKGRVLNLFDDDRSYADLSMTSNDTRIFVSIYGGKEELFLGPVILSETYSDDDWNVYPYAKMLLDPPQHTYIKLLFSAKIALKKYSYDSELDESLPIYIDNE